MSKPLVIVEWEKSRDAVMEWKYSGQFRPKEVCKCVSVGFLLQSDIDAVVLASNLADLETPFPSMSGVINIPVRAVVSLKVLDIKKAELKGVSGES